jgi:outer membrane receptor protein involved in Fe transport
MKKLFLLGSFVSFLLYSSAIAQIPERGPANYDPSNVPSDGYMSGIILDSSTDKPVEFAIVAIYNQRDSSLVNGGITDSLGKFEFKGLGYGPYYLEVKFVGFRDTRMTGITVTPKNKSIDLGAIRIENTATDLGNVVVTGERPQMSYKIDRKVVFVESNVTAIGGTAVDVLENTPSIQTDIEGNVTLRGSSNFTVLIDNRPSVLEGSEALQQIPASTIERIEIITNPSAKYDPDGTAGIINVILKEQKRKGVNGLVDLSYGRFNQYSADALLNYRLNKLNFFAGFELQNRAMRGEGTSKRESYLNDTTIFLDSEEHGKFGGKGNELRAGIEFFPDENNMISIEGGLDNRGFGRTSNSEYHSYTLPLTQDIYYLQDNSSKRNGNSYNLSLNYDRSFGSPDHKLQATAYYSHDKDGSIEELTDIQTNSEWIENDPAPFMQRARESGSEDEVRFNADYYRPIGAEGKLEAGYQLRYESENTDYHYDEFDHIANDWVNFEDRNNDFSLMRNIQAAYAIFGTATKIVDFQVGLRAEYTDRVLSQRALNEEYKINRIDFFPSAYITKRLPFEQQLQLSYSRRINRPRTFFLDPFPSYEDKLNIRMGNPKLEPEYVDSYELNYQKMNKKTSITAELYYRQTNNMMSRVSSLRDDNVMVSTMANIGKDHSFGTELMFTAKPWKWWDISLTGTLFRYWIKGEIEGEKVDQMTTTWNARLNNNFKLKWNTRIQLMAFYNAPSVTAQGERGGSFMLNGGVRQDFLKNKLTAAFQIRDIFRTMHMTDISRGTNFYTYNERRPMGPVFTFTLSWRINNFKKEANGPDETNEIEYQGQEEF